LSPRLYDIEADPAEQHDLASAIWRPNWGCLTNEAQPQTVSRWGAKRGIEVPEQGGGERLVSKVRCADPSEREEFRTVKKLALFTTSLGVQEL
jgi:hypothetical protein